MTFLSVLMVINYSLVLIYGLFLSAGIAGGWQTQRQRNTIIALCPTLLLVQALGAIFFGVDMVQRIYPVIVHLPLVLILIFVLKKTVGIAVVSVLTAYLCCQFPNWAKMAIDYLTASPVVAEIGYMVVIVPCFYLLNRFMVKAAHRAMTFTNNSLLLFGSLPLFYYLFDYVTTVYFKSAYHSIAALQDFLPTAVCVFYIVFLSAYHAQEEKWTQANLQNTLLRLELKQSAIGLENMRQTARRAAVYQHDMRHHMLAIKGFLETGENAHAMDYVQKITSNLEKIAIARYCENSLVNLLCSSFRSRAEELNIDLTIKAKVSPKAVIPDTELCSLLSNGLENALQAVEGLAPPHNWVNFYCEEKLNKLLIEIKNPYQGELVIKDGLPWTEREGHGYGCRSIRTIAEHHRGLCTMDAENGVFTLRVVLPFSRQPGREND
ncbi:MAG: GHKL domain-containing protein [Oscillospiraceae bacterium]|nr:GHKL domain-containing protein [Oscillospiraceae bacterium]